MIDTFEISINTSYQIIILVLRELGEKLAFDKKGIYTLTNPVQQPGIQQLRITDLKNTSSYRVTLTINPKQLITGIEAPLLFKCTSANIILLEEKLNEELEYLHSSFSLKKTTWQLSRIDYASQFYTEYHQLYPLLESKGAVPVTNTDYGFDGSTYRGNKSTKLNAYSKQLQVQNSKHSKQYKDATMNLYRFEKQCHKPSVLYKKYNLRGSNLFALFNEEIAYKELKAFHKRHFKAGDYYTRIEAIKKLNAIKGKQQQSKDLAVEVLDFITSEETIRNALIAIKNRSENVPKRFRAKDNNESYNVLRDRFNDYIRHHLCYEGINPILLPEEYCTSFVLNSYTELFKV